MSGTVLLSRVECLCGRSAAIPEGGFFPLCSSCGRRMMAPPPERRVHYVSEPLSLHEAVRRHTTTNDWTHFPGSLREYSDVDLKAALAERGFPVDAPEWPQRQCPDSDDPADTYGVPPWEAQTEPV